MKAMRQTKMRKTVPRSARTTKLSVANAALTAKRVSLLRHGDV